MGRDVSPKVQGDWKSRSTRQSRNLCKSEKLTFRGLIVTFCYILFSLKYLPQDNPAKIQKSGATVGVLEFMIFIRE